MFIVDIKGNQTVRPIGTTFAGVGFKLVLVTQEEISQVVEPERWREYLEQTLMPRMMPGGLIFVLEETIKKEPALAGYSWRQMFPATEVITREEKTIKIIDELLVLFSLYQKDYEIIEMALNVVAEARKRNPEFPITVSLNRYMEEQGLL